jgi:tetratricopeptide (TPR) repeat protein
MVQTEFVDYYRVLGVDRDADAKQVKEAVTRQRRIWLRRQGSADPQSRAEADSMVRNIRRAEEILLDPEERRGYDAVARTQTETQGPATLDPSQNRDWLEVARGYLRVDNPASAHAAAREAINNRAGDHAAWAVRGHASFLLGNARDAEFELNEAVRIKPDEPQYHLDLGDMYVQQRRWKSGLEQFQQVLRITPRDPFARTAIAEIYLSNDREAEALEIMQEVHKDFPDNPAFSYFLSVAIHDEALTHLSQVGKNEWLITSEQQARLIELAAQRIRTLGCQDKDVIELIGGLQSMVVKARTVIWAPSRHKGSYLACLVILGLFPIFSGQPVGVILGLLVMTIVVTVYVSRHRRPGWAHAARLAPIIKPGV